MNGPSLPKAELHVHLEGSLDVETLLAIEPSLTREAIEASTAYSDFAGFLRAFVWVNRLLREPAHYALAARRLFERLAAQGAVYAEVTLSAGVVLWKDMDLDAIYGAVWEESRHARFPVFWILDAVRQFGPEAAMPVVRFAARHLDRGVAAFGIGGDELRGPARDFGGVFQCARELGLRLTCHAGETAGPESVAEALAIGAERIGHGIAAARDPKLMRVLRERDVPLEVCITSNVRTGAVASIEEHPLRTLFEAGVPIVLSTDDPALFDCTLDSEYALAASRFGFSAGELAALAANSLRYGFRARSEGL